MSIKFAHIGGQSLCARAASVHAGLASLVEREGANLEGRRILMYSYGSGLAASLWSVVGRQVEGKFALSNVSSQVCRPLPLTCHEQQVHLRAGAVIQPRRRQLQKGLTSSLPSEAQHTCTACETSTLDNLLAAPSWCGTEAQFLQRLA